MSNKEMKEEISGGSANLPGRLVKQDSKLFEEGINLKSITTKKEIEQDEDICCRYCWDNTVSESNPIVWICECKKDTGAVHVDCMKSFLNTTKMEMVRDKVLTLFWKKFECEICTHPLPLSITVNE